MIVEMVPITKPTALPDSRASQERPVASPRCPGGNHSEDTTLGNVTTNGPIAPFTIPPTCAKTYGQNIGKYFQCSND